MGYVKATVCVIVGVGFLLVVLFATLVLTQAFARRGAPSGWKTLRAGITTQQVHSILGPPISVDQINYWGRRPNAEQWQYSFGSNGRRGWIQFTNGQVEVFSP
jgi:hypothetical protein